ncbi:MAG: acyl carrier protein [Acidobacteriia bacterium]|nr:acyl carrier protein [Terriglobia bacterium]
MEDLLQKVRRAFSATFDVDPSSVNFDTSPKNIPAWDSMGHVALASKLEREFGLTFDVDELMEMEDVRQIVRIVESKSVKS